MKLISIFFAMGAALLATAGGAYFATVDGWFQAPLAPRGDVAAFANAAKARIDAESRGNAVLLLLDDGRVVAEHTYSIGAPVDHDTLFQVASLSKWITAYGVMALVEDGRLNLDVPVSRYLTRWELPENGYDNGLVTARRLLSHRAGLVDGLGYGGFEPGETVQTVEASLTRAADASPGRDSRTLVGMNPGTEWRYSGGGFTLLQLLVEEISGQRFEDYMQQAVFRPLGMTRSTFEPSSGVANLAVFHDVDGSEAIHYRFTALAAASLYTTANDLERFLRAQIELPVGGRSAETLAAMRRPEARQLGAAIWGLGTMLYAPNGMGGNVIGHDGSNAPAINTAARIDPDSGDGIILLATGNELLASQIAGDWVFWRFGANDLLTFSQAMPGMLRFIGVSWLLILVAAGVALRRLRREAASAG